MRSAVLAIFLLYFPLPAWAQVEIENPWSRATAPGAKIAAGYMVLRNAAPAPDRLISAESPLAARIETHMTVRDGDVLRMREVQGYEVPANGSFELKPGGAHLMIVDIKRPFREGDRIPVTLRFERAGKKQVELQVSRVAPAGAGAHHKH
jgi:copper(I)-binding protein